MNKTLKITVTYSSGIFSTTVFVEEDGKFCKLECRDAGIKRYTLTAGIIENNKIAFGMYYCLEDFLHEAGQDLFFGRIGGKCGAVFKSKQFMYDPSVSIEIEELQDYVPKKDEILRYDDMRIYERMYTEHIMEAVENCMTYVNKLPEPE